jgi:O-antigen/teichoic acid export membrane protein
VLATLIQAVVYQAWIGRIRWRWDTRRARELLRGGWPSMLTILVGMLPLQAGVLLARGWKTEHEVGVYGLAVAVASAHLGVGILAVRVIQPHVSGRYGTDPTFVRKLILFGGAFLGGLWLVTAAAAYVLIDFLLDPSYRPALTPLLLLLVATTGLLVGAFANLYLIGFGRERLMMRVYVAGAGAYLVIALLLREQPLSGLAGAAAAAMTGAAAAAVATVVALWPARSDNILP